MILTSEQILDTPIQYLQRRFNNTFVIHPEMRLIHVLSVDARVRYKRVESLFHALYPHTTREETMFLDKFQVEHVSPANLGYINTPFGAIRIEDKAGRQWTWGFSQSRFNVRYVAETDKITPSVIAYCAFNPSTYPEQFIRGEEVAVGHDYIWKKDNHVYDRFGYDIALIDESTKEIEEIFLPTFEDEFKEEWSKLWN